MIWSPTQPALTGSPLDRAAHLRDDPAALAAFRGHPRARALALDDDDRILFRLLRPVAQEGAAPLALAWRALADIAPTEAPAFLGLWEGAPCFAAHAPAPPGDGLKFIDLRSASLSGDLDAQEAAVAAQAKAMIGWHRTHPRCARCGATTAPAQGGWKRACVGCGAEHFPRTDPVVIMLLVHEDRVALARNVRFPGALFSLIAGFVEPGETIEEAARRESFEELGLRCGRVRYVSSQPWPFPSTLMIGCAVEALDDAFTLEAAEIAEARWFDRAAVRRVFAGEEPGIAPPRRDAIAATLLSDWLAGRIAV